MGVRAIVTGGMGFIGSQMIRICRESPEFDLILNYDKLTYSGDRKNCPFQDDESYRFVEGDICDEELLERLISTYDIDIIYNFAAESHVDNSIHSSSVFVDTNVNGVRSILDCIKRVKYTLGKDITLIQVSTDEVYGSLEEGETGFVESTPLSPNNPYSATKAAADLLIGSYVNTFGLRCGITRCSNNYGPRQHPEKLIPKMLKAAKNDQKLTVYGDGLQIRDWIHVSDHCAGILLFGKAIHSGDLSPGDVMNFGGTGELTNLEVVHSILRFCGKDETLIQFVEDRLGHDRRYAIDYSKATESLGWRPLVDWVEGINSTLLSYTFTS